MGIQEELTRLIEAEKKRLGVGSEEFTRRHNEIMQDIERLLRKEREPEMVTLKEASSRTGLSYDCLRKMCLNNKIVYVKAGSKFLVNFGKLTDYLNGEAVQDIASFTKCIDMTN